MLSGLVQRLSQAFRFFRYRIEALDAHGIHSPFVFSLYTEVICNRLRLAAYQPIETERQRLLRDKSKISITDFGAGSSIRSQRQRKVSDIARHSAKSARFARLLHRLVLRFRPEQVLDLGTSLGITTAYLASAAKPAPVVTFEGCPNTAALARHTFDNLHLQNIQIVTGNMDETLPRVLADLEKVDFVFFDGNHRYEPTVRYFELCLAKAHEQSLFIFDDIHWSREMKQAWQTIKNHPRVRLTLDLYFIGLVFFRTQQPKQHFVLRF